MAKSTSGVLERLLGILEEAKVSKIPEDRLNRCLKSIISKVDPLTKGYRILNCLLFQIYPVLFLLSLLGYPLFKLLDGSPCLIAEVTPFGEAMIPVMNCRYVMNMTVAHNILLYSLHSFIYTGCAKEYQVPYASEICQEKTLFTVMHMVQSPLLWRELLMVGQQ